MYVTAEQTWTAYAMLARDEGIWITSQEKIPEHSKNCGRRWGGILADMVVIYVLRGV
jgi:hypothetical protein